MLPTSTTSCPRPGISVVHPSRAECPCHPSPHRNSQRSKMKDGCVESGMFPQLHVYVLEGSLVAAEEGSSDSRSRDLDASLWSKLPGELVERVVLTLPPASQIRCRTVCRKWLALLSSPSGLRESARLARPQRNTVCAFRYRPRPLAYPLQGAPPNPSLAGHRLHKLDLSFLPSAFQVQRFDGIVTQDGWICVKVRDPVLIAVEHFCVFNPLTRTCRTLPDLDVHQQCFGAMTVMVDRGSPGDFEVTVVCGDDLPGPNRWTVAVYSSRDDHGAWKMRSSEPASDTRFSNCRMVFCNGLVCSFDYEANSILFHDLADARLVKRAELRTPELAAALLANFRLVEHSGCILFVGLFVQENAPHYGIWRLDQGCMTWEAVSHMSDALRTQLMQSVRDQHADYEVEVNLATLGGVAVVGETIFMSIYTQAVPRNFARHRSLMTWSHVIGFSIPQGAWKVYMQDAGDVVRTELVTPTGFLQPRLNDYLP